MPWIPHGAQRNIGIRHRRFVGADVAKAPSSHRAPRDGCAAVAAIAPWPRGVQKFVREASTRRSTQLSINDEVDDSDIVVSVLGGLQ